MQEVYPNVPRGLIWCPVFNRECWFYVKKVEGNIRDFEGGISEVLIFTVCKKLGVKGKGLE